MCAEREETRITECNDQGIVTIAFGEEYDKLAAATMRYSRRFTQLPICVLTNIKPEDRNTLWETVDNVKFETFPWSQDHNRSIKTQMNIFTPFEQTLFLDCDAVIQKTGIEQAFDLIPKDGLLLYRVLRWEVGGSVYKLYRTSMQTLQTRLPLDVWNSAFMGWRKSPITNTLFEVWHKFWRLTGCGRDMPALACAAKTTEIEVTTTPPQFFHMGGPTFDRDAIIQHHYACISFYENFNLPDTFTKYKPFDKNNNDDWTWVSIDEA